MGESVGIDSFLGGRTMPKAAVQSFHSSQKGRNTSAPQHGFGPSNDILARAGPNIFTS
jgi:hypothetical protein